MESYEKFRGCGRKERGAERSSLFGFVLGLMI